jgi:hypothetical protein
MKFRVHATYNIKEEAEKFEKELVIVEDINDDWENYFEIEINTLEELLEFCNKAKEEVIITNRREKNGMKLEIYNGYRE